jgi:hypothetical protein
MSHSIRMEPLSSENSRPLRRSDLLALAMLVGLMVLLPIWYVTSERAIYISDYAGFQDAAIDLALEARRRLASGLRPTVGLGVLVWRSTGWDYSLLPAVLPAPVLLALHGGRIVYIVTSALLYLLPCAVAFGALAASLSTPRSRGAFWAGVGLTVAMPAFWVPTLRGYPDAGALALVATAVMLYVRDTAFRARWTAAGIGVSLAVAVLFRRHYAYPALSLLAVIGASGVLSLASRRSAPPALAWWRGYSAEMSGAIRTSLWCAASMLLLGAPFVWHATGTDYIALYASYMVSPRKIVGWIIEAFGWIACIAAMLGYLFAWRWRTLDRKRLTLVLCIYLLTLLLWTFRVRQIGPHYVLHFVPLVALGQFALVWTVAHQVSRPVRVPIATAALVLLGLNLVHGLAPARTLPAPLDGTRWFASSHPPLHWSDYDEVMRLVKDLRRIAGTSEPIYVASSRRLRSSTLLNADRMLEDPFRAVEDVRKVPRRNRLNVPHSPHVDSRDENPTGALMRAAYVIVATPPQYQLAPEQQRVVRAAVEAFSPGWELASDFDVLPATYTLETGGRVRVYRRVRPSTLAVALRTFARMRAAHVGADERGQPIPLAAGTLVRMDDGTRGGPTMTMELPPNPDTLSLVLPREAPLDTRLHTTATLNGVSCGRIALSAAPLAGDTLPSTATVAVVETGPPATLELPIRGSGSAVLLRVWRDGATPLINGCNLKLRGVVLGRP